MDIFFVALLSGLFALTAAELVALGVSQVVSLIRPDVDPSDAAHYIRRIGVLPATTCCGLFFGAGVVEVILIAGAAGAVTLLLQAWLSRPVVIQQATRRARL